ncbi:hypothetical protein ACIPLR_03910 [Herbaspirillum huttiense]|uniref:hypothetical protein n=1 Tax=Herbaspirillum TaxID=963 RepID=UPI001AC313B9|nr:MULTISPECIES: hypothetical protein [Herbaspirillum]MBN9358549.1 hypothetical protein [Herbaspirillum huttiense]|tara:strand:- start:9363 stop:9539 length:177 start_codon:yes stop_codon:yes gene_type:complete
MAGNRPSRAVFAFRNIFLGRNSNFPKVFGIAVEKGFAWSFKARSFSSESLEKDFLQKP